LRGLSRTVSPPSTAKAIRALCHIETQIEGQQTTNSGRSARLKADA
jgi:hypothetical protein